MAKDDTIAALKAMEYNLVHSVLLKGTKGVKKVAMRSMTIQKYNEETNGWKFPNAGQHDTHESDTSITDSVWNGNDHY